MVKLTHYKIKKTYATALLTMEPHQRTVLVSQSHIIKPKFINVPRTCFLIGYTTTAYDNIHLQFGIKSGMFVLPTSYSNDTDDLSLDCGEWIPEGIKAPKTKNSLFNKSKKIIDLFWQTSFDCSNSTGNFYSLPTYYKINFNTLEFEYGDY